MTKALENCRGVKFKVAAEAMRGPPSAVLKSSPPGGINTFAASCKDTAIFIMSEAPTLPSTELKGLLNLPFKICSFEVTGNAALYTLIDPQVGRVSVQVMWVAEVTPGVYETCLFSDFRGDVLNSSYIIRLGPGIEVQQQQRGISLAIQDICDNLGKSELGAEQKPLYVKLPRKGFTKPVTHRINMVVRMCRRGEEPSIKSVLGGHIDWSHKWQVRGHWRKVSGIGKDRDGEYGISGYTWITPCVKGRGELVRKIRLIPKEKNDPLPIPAAVR